MDVAKVTSEDHVEDRAAVVLDHPEQAGPRSSRWGRFTARLRRADRPAATPVTIAPAPPEPHPEPVAAPTRITSAPVIQSAAARRIAFVLAVLLAVVIGVAFRGSWTAHSDGAKAAHFDDWGAWLYPFAPDGLIVLALVGAVVLRHQRGPRIYCLGVVALFTVTSYVVNHLHGLGKFEMVGESDVLKTALDPWVVGLIALQLVGAIAFGSHILMHVFRHLFPEALDIHSEAPTANLAVTHRDVELVATPAGSVEMSDPAPVRNEPEAPEVDGYEFAKLLYAACLDGGVKLSQEKLGTLARISKRKAGYARVDVDNERAAAEESEPEDNDFPGVLGGRSIDREEFLRTGAQVRVNGHGPAGGA
ncbi:DUF2637 domain-containing protein [Streptosporangium sp. NPDC049078]|uniref:DUF2637 domain-containing protein n=1 Tax=Streptosporangium sp. NPDC049078 TaxID=3155767 RepID=UPI003417A52E